MSYKIFAILYPLWIMIAVNLLMTVVNFCIPWNTAFADWYFDENGAFKIMVPIWAAGISWSVMNGIITP